MLSDSPLGAGQVLLSVYSGSARVGMADTGLQIRTMQDSDGGNIMCVTSGMQRT